MTQSIRLTRRGMLLSASALAALEIFAVRAQSTTGCAIGFVNGLLQYSPDCPLLTPAGVDFEVAPPSHLVQTAEGDGTTSEVQSQQARKREARTRKRDKQDEQHDRLKTRHKDQRQRRKDRRRLRRQERRAAKRGSLGCDDFTYQEEAQAYFDSGDYDTFTDPQLMDTDDDGIACETLPNAPTT